MLAEYSQYLMKYSSPMACYVSRTLTDLRDADDYDTHPGEVIEGWARLGRRVLTWNDQGFVGLWTYATAEEAAADCHYYDHDEEEG